jgi:lipoprotein
MKETLPKSSFLRDKVAKPAAGLAIVSTSLGIGGCSAEPKPDMYKMSVAIACDGQSHFGKPGILSYENDVNGRGGTGNVDRVTIGCQTWSMDADSSQENDARIAGEVEERKLTEEEQEGNPQNRFYDIVSETRDDKTYTVDLNVTVDKPKEGKKDAATELPHPLCYEGNYLVGDGDSGTIVYEISDPGRKVNPVIDPKDTGGYTISKSADGKISYMRENPSPDANFVEPPYF